MSLALNLGRRQAMVHAAYPTMTIYWIGDQSHQSEAGGSDHNPDARGIVHAIDIMTETDSANNGAAAVILAWLLADVTDLQYVIHDRVIYGRDEKHGWKGASYTGSDPHTNHIHVSGKHGTVGKNAATGTGYDLAAEAYTPAVTLLEFMEATMPLSPADIAAIWAYKIPNGLGHTAALALGNVDVRTDATTNKQLPALSTALSALQTGLTPAAIAAAITAAYPLGVPVGVSAEALGDVLHRELVADAQKTAAALAAPTP